MSTHNKQFFLALLAIYRKARGFDPATKTDEICKKFANYMEKSGLTGCIISVSGGVDSAVVYALAKETQKRYPLIIKKVTPIAQPIHSSQWSLDRAYEMCELYDDELKIIDQSDIFDLLVDKIDNAIGIKGNKFAQGMLKSYMRTPINYYIAQLQSQEHCASLVLGTGNFDEDMYLKYYCKAGDGVVDIQYIHDCHKSEVFALGAYLKIPKSILESAPSADLWEGQEDEIELDVKYNFIEYYVGYYQTLSPVEQIELVQSFDKDMYKWFLDNAKTCENIHHKNAHKESCAVNL